MLAINTLCNKCFWERAYKMLLSHWISMRFESAFSTGFMLKNMKQNYSNKKGNWEQIWFSRLHFETKMISLHRFSHSIDSIFFRMILTSIAFRHCLYIFLLFFLHSWVTSWNASNIFSFKRDLFSDIFSLSFHVHGQFPPHSHWVMDWENCALLLCRKEIHCSFLFLNLKNKHPKGCRRSIK